MPLSRRVLLIAAALAIVAATIAALVIAAIRGADRGRLLDHVSASFLTEVTRESCESDPQWFLAGPRIGRPSREERAQPDADVRLPRPSTEPLPFEFYAYDEQFLGSSVAAPRFPDSSKRLMRQSPPQRIVRGSYDDDRGTGLYIARWTGWAPGPCAILLFRLPEEDRFWTSAAIFFLVFGGSLGVGVATALPIAARVRRVAQAVARSVKNNYAEMAPITGNDEITSLAATFNETASDIRVRITDAQDREEALRRYVASTTEDVAGPLAELERPLSQLVSAQPPGSEPARLAHELSREAHRLSMRLQNLGAVIRLRTITESSPRETVDVSALVADIVRSRESLAASAQVTMAAAVDPGIAIEADTLLIRQAIANVLDNAILYAGPHARVLVELKSYEQGRRFSLRVADTGRGVSSEEFAGLTANRRFRGDEARTRRPNERGLGLALAREIADRFGLQLDIRRPTAGGLEVEIATRRSDLFSTAFR